MSNKVREELSKDNIQNKTKKKSNVTTTNGGVLNILIRWKATDFKAKSYNTHSEELARFEVLNKLISLYWNNETILKKTDTEEDSYKAQIKSLGKKTQ